MIKILAKILILFLAIVMVAGAISYWFFSEPVTKLIIDYEREQAGLTKQYVRAGKQTWPYLITGRCVNEGELSSFSNTNSSNTSTSNNDQIDANETTEPEASSVANGGVDENPQQSLNDSPQNDLAAASPTDEQRWAAVLARLSLDKSLDTAEEQYDAQQHIQKQAAENGRNLRNYTNIKPLGEYTPGSIRESTSTYGYASTKESEEADPHDGACIFQESNPGAPTIVLLHGFSASKENWVRFAKHLQSDYRVIIPDLPGFGESKWEPQLNYDIPRQAKRLKTFLNTVAPNTRIHLIGNSMGGNLAAFYAAFHQDQIATVALFNNSGIKPTKPSEMDLIQQDPDASNPLIVNSTDDYGRVLNFVMTKKPWIPPPVKKHLAQQALDNRDRNAAIFSQYQAQRRGWLQGYLPLISQPTLVLWGKQDRVIDVSTIDNMRLGLENETVVVMPDVGHVPMIEAPAESAQHYLEFLQAAEYGND